MLSGLAKLTWKRGEICGSGLYIVENHQVEVELWYTDGTDMPKVHSYNKAN